MRKVDCLIVRQPYSSLIAYGLKRWEFRGYDTKKTGIIGIAASNAEPLRTKNDELNRILHLFPRGVILASANLVASFFVTANDLKQFLADPVTVAMHGNEIRTLAEPIGEPLEDVRAAANDNSWQSFSWLLEDVKPLKKPIPFERVSQSTWSTVELDI